MASLKCPHEDWSRHKAPSRQLSSKKRHNCYEKEPKTDSWRHSLSTKHRVLKKNFETEIRVDKVDLPLNHFVQETLANIMFGFLKTLKEIETEEPTTIEVKIKRLPRSVEVDAHKYP